MDHEKVQSWEIAEALSDYVAATTDLKQKRHDVSYDDDYYLHREYERERQAEDAILAVLRRFVRQEVQAQIKALTTTGE